MKRADTGETTEENIMRPMEKGRRRLGGCVPRGTDEQTKEMPNAGATTVEQKNREEKRETDALSGKTVAKRGPATPMRKREEKLTGAQQGETMRAQDGQKKRLEDSVLGASGGPPLGTQRHPEALDEEEKARPTAVGQGEKAQKREEKGSRGQQGEAGAAAGKATDKQGEAMGEGKWPSQWTA